MESATMLRSLSPSVLRSSASPSRFSSISERRKPYARNRIAANHVVRVPSEKSEGGSHIDRRQLLLSSTILGISALSVPKAFSAPFTAPDSSAAPKFLDSPKHLTELKAPVTIRVKRPIQKRSTKEKEEAEEVLSVEGIQVDTAETLKFSIFINYPEATAETPMASPHYAGSFVSHGKRQGSTAYKIGITETLEDVGADEDESITVTLVPQASKYLPKTPIKFTSVKIAYDAK